MEVVEAEEAAAVVEVLVHRRALVLEMLAVELVDLDHRAPVDPEGQLRIAQRPARRAHQTRHDKWLDPEPV